MKRKHDLLKPFWTPFSWESEGEWDFNAPELSGLSIYEEGDYLFIEASVPGLSKDDIELYHNHGYIVIEGKKQEEEKKRKYYRKASTAFSYRIPIPSDVDQDADPEAIYKDGVMTLKFKKGEKKKKHIPIKEEG